MKIKQPRRHLRHMLCFLAALFVAPFLLSIAAIGSPQFQTGDQITVGAQEVIEDNFYAAGDRVTLDGTIKGNVFAKGDIVDLTGTIENDVYLAGETITIDGTVKGDAILAGELITINGSVEGDLVAAGQSIVVNGTVKDDARIAGESLLLMDNAQVTDDVIAAGFSLESRPQSKNWR
ncbi:MAG: polymer-forming cytoskeletal protein [Cyanobacteria bacterium P01_A01_bin.17]